MAADKPNFSGQWMLNTSKSDFGERTAPVRSLMKIVHQDPRLNITRVLTTDSGENGTGLFDRWQRDVEQLPNGGVMKSTAKWDGSSLLIETPVGANGKSLTIEWRWTLSEDGRRLTTARALPMGDGARTDVFEK